MRSLIKCSLNTPTETNSRLCNQKQRVNRMKMDILKGQSVSELSIKRLKKAEIFWLVTLFFSKSTTI